MMNRVEENARSAPPDRLSDDGARRPATCRIEAIW
jgi:hypothetical protein